MVHFVRLIALTLVGFVLLGCKPSQADSANTPTGTAVGGQGHPGSMRAAHIGPLRLGMPEKELTSLGLPLTWKGIEAEDAPYRVAEVETSQGTVSAGVNMEGVVDILSTKVVPTDAGAKVGMTFAELEKIYPRGMRLAGTDDGGYLIFDTQVNYGFFRFNAGSVPGKCLENLESCNDVISDQLSYEYYVQ